MLNQLSAPPPPSFIFVFLPLLLYLPSSFSFTPHSITSWSGRESIRSVSCCHYLSSSACTICLSYLLISSWCKHSVNLISFHQLKWYLGLREKWLSSNTYLCTEQWCGRPLSGRGPTWSAGCPLHLGVEEAKEDECKQAPPTINKFQIKTNSHLRSYCR